MPLRLREQDVTLSLMFKIWWSSVRMTSAMLEKSMSEISIAMTKICHLLLIISEAYRAWCSARMTQSYWQDCWIIMLEKTLSVTPIRVIISSASLHLPVSSKQSFSNANPVIYSRCNLYICKGRQESLGMWVRSDTRSLSWVSLENLKCRRALAKTSISYIVYYQILKWHGQWPCGWVVLYI